MLGSSSSNVTNRETLSSVAVVSYHGGTLHTLSLGHHIQRRCMYEPLLSQNFGRVSACNPYHDREEGMSDEEYVMRKAKELEEEMERLGPRRVIAFVYETVAGAVSEPSCCLLIIV